MDAEAHIQTVQLSEIFNFGISATGSESASTAIANATGFMNATSITVGITLMLTASGE